MRRLLARMRGAWYTARARSTGGRVTIAPGLLAYARLDVRGPGRVAIGPDAVIARAGGDCLEFVTIYTRAPEAEVTIGARARLCGARVSCRHAITIGDDVLIESAGVTDTDFHSLDRERGEPRGEERERCAVVIGDRVGIGARAMITKGSRVGSDVVIAPGAIVSRALPAGCFALGNPARAFAPAAPAQPNCDTM